MEALLLELSDNTVLLALREARKHYREVQRLKLRSLHISTVTFNINSLSDRECLEDYRFKKQHIVMLSELIGWSGVSERNMYACDNLVSSCVFFHRLSSTIRWSDVETRYGMFRSQLSEVFWEVTELFHGKFEHALELRSDLLRQRASVYAKAIEDYGAPLDKCVGFIDCTKIKMQRPGGSSQNQRCVYSGHKRFHCLIYQTMTTPDGLVFALYGPEEGRRHDLTLLRKSGWNERLQEALLIDGEYYYIYGDSAYMLRPWMQRPFQHGLCSAQEAIFNAAMSAVRVTVEHSYKDIKKYWTSQDFARMLKVRKAPISLLYRSSCLLFNIRTCLYGGGQVQHQYHLRAPSVEEYLQLE